MNPHDQAHRRHQQVVQQQIQQQWQDNNRRFREWNEDQQRARLMGVTEDTSPMSGRAVALSILLFLIVIAAGALVLAHLASQQVGP